MSFYIPAYSNVICVQKFFFNVFNELFMHMCQTVIYIKKYYFLTGKEVNRILIFTLLC